MEMIDVLKKLQEIAETKPELVKDAVESVERTNPKEVKENAVESEAPIQEFRNVVTPRDEAHYRELMKQLQDVDLDPATRSDPAMKAEVQKRRSELKNWAEQNLKTEADRQPGGMSDIHIGAQEVVGEFVDDDGNLVQPKADVLKAMAADAKQSPFPKSYEIETAMKMVDEKFEDDGSPKDEMPEPDEVMASAEPQTTETPVQEKTIGQGLPIGTKAFLNMGSKLDINFSRDQAYMVSGVLNRLDQDALLKAVDEYKSQELDPDQAESKELNTNTMTTEGKKQVNEAKKVDEAITMTADSPEEAGMLMQMLKLAGVQQVTPDMIGAEEPTADNDADHDHDGDGQQDHAPQDCNVCACDDAIGSQGMGQVRDIVTAPDDEKAEETFANEPDEKVSDVDTLVNVHSGGLNKQKQQVRKEYPGDNPLASKYETVEDKISEEDLANSLRNQYEGFKKDYQEAAKVAEAKAKPDFLDMDKDGDKKEPMKKAIADKK
jgi:hypothetical protein